MATSHSPLVSAVVDVLGRQQVGFALIGASGMAIHGASRATLDIDLLVTDPRVLSASFWEGLLLAVPEVETRLPLLPARSTNLWRTLRSAPGG
jgi:hypothetical protein